MLDWILPVFGVQTIVTHLHKQKPLFDKNKYTDVKMKNSAYNSGYCVTVQPGDLLLTEKNQKRGGVMTHDASGCEAELLLLPRSRCISNNSRSRVVLFLLFHTDLSPMF